MAKEIVLIAAVGKSGQLGLNGGLPWGEDFPEDRARFARVTTNGIVIVGRQTWDSVKHLNQTHGRMFMFDSTRGNDPIPQFSLDSVAKSQATVFIAGGAKTYTRWMPYITRFDITVLDYDGAADVYMPPIFVRPHVSRKIWLQAQIATIDILKKRFSDPEINRQHNAKLEQYSAELYALDGRDA